MVLVGSVSGLGGDLYTKLYSNVMRYFYVQYN
jgi:hypothetical protein